MLGFLDHLIDWTRQLAVYVLAFARPELNQGRPGFGAGRNRSILILDPLDRASMDALVEALGTRHAGPAAVTGQAQGIPLRSVVDRCGR